MNAARTRHDRATLIETQSVAIDPASPLPHTHQAPSSQTQLTSEPDIEARWDSDLKRKLSTTRERTSASLALEAN